MGDTERKNAEAIQNESRIFRSVRRRLDQELEFSEDAEPGQILDIIDRLVLEEGRTGRMPLKGRERLRRELYNSVCKLDVLQEFIDDPDVTEIMVNGWQNIFYEKGGRLYRSSRTFPSKERLDDIVQVIAGSCNRVVNERSPIVDARLKDGSRVNIVLPPVSLTGPIVTIRRFPEEAITMDSLVRLGSITQEVKDFLKELVAARYTILMIGSTGSGKTTMLNALSGCIPKTERVVTIEDNAELQIQNIDNLVRLEAKQANMEGNREITIRDLIKSSLRMRPDRIIIGEIRGSEAYDFLNCLNTGHTGSLGTVHANSCNNVIGRLEMMVLMGQELPIPVIRRMIVTGIEILVYLARDPDGKRRLYEIAELVPKGDEIDVRTIYKRSENGILEKKADLLAGEKLAEWKKRKQKAASSGL
ncbi:MAG: ATPase, T2SS/T4P/T4SS family [Eubacterium sp.]|nr:ATPase, T2SS/T4P/T4SS family [Eubacterium sp.]